MTQHPMNPASVYRPTTQADDYYIPMMWFPQPDGSSFLLSRKIVIGYLKTKTVTINLGNYRMTTGT